MKARFFYCFAFLSIGLTAFSDGEYGIDGERLHKALAGKTGMPMWFSANSGPDVYSLVIRTLQPGGSGSYGAQVIFAEISSVY